MKKSFDGRCTRILEGRIVPEQVGNFPVCKGFLGAQWSAHEPQGSVPAKPCQLYGGRELGQVYPVPGAGFSLSPGEELS